MDELDMEKHLTSLMKNAEAAKILNQSTPTPRPPKNPFEERMKWEVLLMQTQATKDESKHFRFNTTFLSGESHSCKKPLEELKPIKLCEMKVPMVHTGRYLVCQVIGRPFSFVAATSLIQDLNGDVDEVALYNFRCDFDDLHWLSFLTIMIVKEPWLRYGAHGKIPTIRVDSPTDVIFVDPTDYDFLKKVGAEKWYVSMSKDPEKIRQTANESFKMGDFDKAIMLYNRAIRYNPKLGVLYLNKAMACLRINSYHMAYESAKLGFENGCDPEKALYRIGMAAYGMRQWQKAAEHFIEMLKQFPKHPSASEQLKKATARLNEEKTGKYDFKAMYVESKNGKHDIDVADYKGPIKIANIPGKGRGIVALQDIQSGTLLVVSKAFSSGYSEDYPGILFAANRKRVDSAANVHQVIRAMENIQKNPHRSKDFYDLYSGNSNENEEVPDGIVDAALVQKISAMNRFSSDETDLQNVLAKSSDRLLKSDHCHLFIVPSYFNHSCVANANRTFYGDVMVIHASTDIKKGEEIFLCYTSPLVEYSKRKETLNSWKFECSCKLCQIDAKDPYCSERAKITDELRDFDNDGKTSPQKVIKKAELLLKKIRDTYAQRNKYKTSLVYMLCLLSRRNSLVGNIAKSIQYLEEMVSIVDDVLEDALHMTTTFINLSECYNAVGKFAKAKEYQQKAFKLAHCSDMDHFKLLFPDAVQL